MKGRGVRRRVSAWVMLLVWVAVACRPTAAVPTPTSGATLAPGALFTPTPTSTAGAEALATPDVADATQTPEDEAQPTAAPVPGTPTVAPPTASPTASRQDLSVETEADRDNVFTVRGGNRQGLPAQEQVFLGVGDGVDVDAAGRAILRFGDLLTVEVLRDGDLVVQEASVDEQSAFVTVVQNGGTLLNNFNPQDEIGRRLTIQTEFAVIEATGTQFMVVREAGSPLEWIIGLDAAAEDLTVRSDGVTKPVETGVARWIAPLGEPSAGIGADMAQVSDWLAGVQQGEVRQEIGEVVWSQADVIADMSRVGVLPAPGEPFVLIETGQGTIRLSLGTEGGEYRLADCNGDGIRDLSIRSGKVEVDLRGVLARVRALDATVVNRTEPGSVVVRALDPARSEVAQERIDAGAGQGEVLSLRSEVPYHYAELELRDGCLLGLSLTPPDEFGGPGLPRPAVDNWDLLVPPPGVLTRPPENGVVQALPLQGELRTAIEIDGRWGDWEALEEERGVRWTALQTVVYDPACGQRYPNADVGAVDLAAWVRAAYDGQNLYVAFMVADDGQVLYTGDDLRFFRGDSPQLLLDLDLAGDVQDGGLSGDDVQIDFFPDFNEARAAWWQLESLTSDLYGVRVAAGPTREGYFLEAALPWSSLGVDIIGLLRSYQGWAALGMAASVSDNDTPNADNQECQISTAPQRDWQRPTTWGTLVLGLPR